MLEKYTNAELDVILDFLDSYHFTNSKQLQTMQNQVTKEISDRQILKLAVRVKV
jgi:hypothetical protein